MICCTVLATKTKNIFKKLFCACNTLFSWLVNKNTFARCNWTYYLLLYGIICPLWNLYNSIYYIYITFFIQFYYLSQKVKNVMGCQTIWKNK